MDKITQDQFNWMCQCITDWLQIREQFTQAPPIWNLADVQHSSLLNRILSGKTVFNKPPPKAYSYPWYELEEQGWAYIHSDVSIDPNEKWPVHIAQSTAYDLLSYENGIATVRAHSNGYTYQVEPSDVPVTEIKDGKGVPGTRKGWIIKKISEESVI